MLKYDRVVNEDDYNVTHGEWGIIYPNAGNHRPFLLLLIRRGDREREKEIFRCLHAKLAADGGDRPANDR